MLLKLLKPNRNPDRNIIDATQNGFLVFLPVGLALSLLDTHEERVFGKLKTVIFSEHELRRRTLVSVMSENYKFPQIGCTRIGISVTVRATESARRTSYREFCVKLISSCQIELSFYVFRKIGKKDEV